MNRSVIVKAGSMLVLILLFLIPLKMIEGVVEERMYYKSSVESEISHAWSGEQLFIGPVMTVNYEVSGIEQVWDKELKKNIDKRVKAWRQFQFIPNRLDISGDVETDTRSRGIYNMTVYNSHLNIQGDFKDLKLPLRLGQSETLESIGQVVLSVAVSDVRGLEGLPQLSWGEDAIHFESGSRVKALGGGMHVVIPDITELTQLEQSFSMGVDLRGSRSLKLVSMGKNTSAILKSQWPHPSFFGLFIPSQHDISDDGFVAQWQVSSLASNIEDVLENCFRYEQCSGLENASFGVRFIEAVDIYQKVIRSVKYGVLFIVLTFLAFFMTELLKKKLLHPVQYTMVGFSLAIFYLLLVSMSEHMSFVMAYAIASVSCCGLLGIYLASGFRSAKLGWGFSLVIGALYWMLFGILRSEDFALLMGCLLLFMALAGFMILTRHIDWYVVSGKLEGSFNKPLRKDTTVVSTKE